VTRRLPVFATMLVAAAVAVMIGLGLWQLRRAEWKDELIARYGSAGALPPIAWPPAGRMDEAPPLFRRASGTCGAPRLAKAVAGANRSGETGYVFLVDCAARPGSAPMRVELGWSNNPRASFNWSGGSVSGVLAPDRDAGIRLVVDRSPSGLQPSARPSLSAISNNHLMYAIQWFAFAAIAVVIFLLASRKRLAEPRR
jgi:surfeit locus 1 family protein